MNIISIFPSYYPEFGGIQNVIKNLNENLAKMGHSPKIMCISKNNTLPSHEITNGVEIYRIRDNFYKYLMENQNLFNKADIIHVHGYSTLFSWQVIRFLRRQGYENKIIYNPHYEGIGSTFIKNILYKFYKIIAKSNFEIPQRIICVSKYERNKLINDFKIDNQSKITVIPNGVSYYIPKYPRKRRINRNKIRLLYVGRIKKKKGIHYILKAIKILKEKYSLEVEFNIVGAGNYMNRLRNLAKKHDLKNNINFLSIDRKVSDQELELLYKNSDIFLLLSKSEAYGIVVAEALVHGLIVIVSNNTALKEFIKEKGCFGIDYPPDEAELAELIYKLSFEDIMVGPFNKNKIQNWEVVSKKYESIYRTLEVI